MILSTSFAYVLDLHKRNARHRKGFYMATMPLGDILDHAIDEIEELRDAPDDLMELADSFACLIHYAVCKGWTEEMVDKAIVTKLKLRFNAEGIA